MTRRTMASTRQMPPMAHASREGLRGTDKSGDWTVGDDTSAAGFKRNSPVESMVPTKKRDDAADNKSFLDESGEEVKAGR